MMIPKSTIHKECKKLFSLLEQGKWMKIEENQPIEYYRQIDLLLKMGIIISYRNYVTLNPTYADYVEIELKK